MLGPCGDPTTSRTLRCRGVNWLAHLCLAAPTPLARLGQLAGDFVRGDELASLTPELREGVLQHRALDAFTDAHPAPRRCRARISGPLRRFGPVLVDVFFDHALAVDFERHADGRGLDEFVDGVHADLAAHVGLLPERLRAVAPRLIGERWLGCYAELAGIEATLRRMEGRLRRPAPLRDAVHELAREREAILAGFAEFWPEAKAFAAPWRRA